MRSYLIENNSHTIFLFLDPYKLFKKTNFIKNVSLLKASSFMHSPVFPRKDVTFPIQSLALSLLFHYGSFGKRRCKCQNQSLIGTIVCGVFCYSRVLCVLQCTVLRLKEFLRWVHAGTVAPTRAILAMVT